MKANVSKDACIGCGACTTIVPDFFVFGEDGFAEVNSDYKGKNVPDELTDDVEMARDSCPTGAITTEE